MGVFIPFPRGLGGHSRQEPEALQLVIRNKFGMVHAAEKTRQVVRVTRCNSDYGFYQMKVNADAAGCEEGPTQTV